MRLAASVVRFNMGDIPVVGNTATGAIVGLTNEGATLCDAMKAGSVASNEVPPSCATLVAYLYGHGFLTETAESDGNYGCDGKSLSVRSVASAYVHITYRCNLSCVGCYSWTPARNNAIDPTLEQFERATDVLAGLGVRQIILSGGEPFLRSDLPALVRYAKEAGIAHITILTNGLVCADEQLQALANIADTISVSFDGTSLLSEALVRGSQRFDQLIDTIRRIKHRGIHAHMLPTVHARNIDDIPLYLELARRLDVTVGFSMLSGSRDALGDLYFDHAALQHLAEVVGMYHAALGDEGVFVSHGSANGMRACVACGAGSINVSIAANGAVYPCHMLHVSELRLGNAFVDDASQLAARIRTFSLPSVDEMDDCSKCAQRYLCGGGCRGRSFIEHGRLDARDPYCAYYQRAVAQTVDRFVHSLSGR